MFEEESEQVRRENQEKIDEFEEKMDRYNEKEKKLFDIFKVRHKTGH